MHRGKGCSLQLIWVLFGGHEVKDLLRRANRLNGKVGAGVQVPGHFQDLYANNESPNFHVRLEFTFC